MALINCPECGKEISDAASNCTHCGFPIEDYLNGVKIIPEEQTNQPINLGKVKNDSHRTTKMFSNMKTWKLVSGIISMVLFAFVTFQSCAIGIANTIEENGEISGSAGILVAILMLSGGIVSVAARNSKKGGNIALIILFGLAALIGFTSYGNYSDLFIWSIWCLVNAVLALFSLW